MRSIERYSEYSRHSQQRDVLKKRANTNAPAISRSHLHRYRQASSI